MILHEGYSYVCRDCRNNVTRSCREVPQRNSADSIQWNVGEAMIGELRLSWQIGSAIGDVNATNWEDVFEKICSCWHLGGCVRLYFLGEGRTINQIEMSGQYPGEFLLSMILDGEKFRNYTDSEVELYPVVMFGEYFNSSMFCRKFDDIKRAFSEFFSRRDVDENLLE